MDFGLTPRQSAILCDTREFARGELADSAPSDGFDRAAWDKLAAKGFAGLPVPERWGGAGWSAFETALAIEALGGSSRDTGLVFSLGAHLFTAAVPLWKAGTDAQREQFLVPLARGHWIGANAITEEESGSNASDIATRAERRGDRYVLTGCKWFSSNAPVADVFVAYATVDRTLGFAGVTAFVIPRQTPGVVVHANQDKIGLRGSPLSEVRFDGVEIPAAYRLGAEGAGSMVFAESMRWERACLFALYVGTMERQLERALAFAKSRRSRGQPIGKFQSIANRLVDMKLRLDTSRLLVQRAAWMLDQGRPCDGEIALSKLCVSESAVASALDAIQIHGGRGCLSEYGVDEDLRNAIPGRIFSGTSEIQRVIVGRCLGL